jgi:3-hydroxyacyl-CoA dehydrogenase
MKTFRRVAVLGAGTMGSRIAAHFANAGIPVLLLDLTSAAAAKGIETAMKQKPGAFFTDAAAKLITPGNFDDDLAAINNCDWIIEAVAENLEIKRGLFRKVEGSRAADSIVSTNTSGIPLAQIAEGFGAGMRAYFLGTHFFNPPRYLHLVEVIPGPDTRPEILDLVSHFCDVRLGKGVVPCKDTPNFIGNRIGSFFAGTIQKITVEDDYTIEEVDALTGPLIGLPKSASYRLMDIVGLDIWGHVARNLYESAANDPWRERFVLPGFMLEMIERGWIGDKAGQGFYQRVGPAKEIHAIDWKTLEYHPAKKVRFPSVDAARNMEDLGSRLRTLIATPDRAGSFCGSCFAIISFMRQYGPGNFRSRCGDRPRHALGLRQYAGTFRAVGRARFPGYRRSDREGRRISAAERREDAFLGRDVVLSGIGRLLRPCIGRLSRD